jgi:hypothetical protein
MLLQHNFLSSIPLQKDLNIYALDELDEIIDGAIIVNTFDNCPWIYNKKKDLWSKVVDDISY